MATVQQDAPVHGITDEWPDAIVLLRTVDAPNGQAGHLIINTIFGKGTSDPLTIDALAAFETEEAAVMFMVELAATGRIKGGAEAAFEPELVTFEEACDIALSKSPEVKGVALCQEGVVTQIRHVR